MTPFRATLRSEWTKLMSRRATLVVLGIGIVVGVGLSALLAFTAGATWDEWEAPDRLDFDPISFSMVGGIFSVILFAVLGVTAVTSEYSSGMIRLTLTATPRRGRLLAAKAAVVAAATLIAGTVATLAMFLVSQAIFSSYGLESSGLTDGDALRAVIATSVLSPLLPLIGLSFAFALRSTAGAITSVLALAFAPAIFGGLLPQWWQDNVLAYVPGTATDAIALGHLPGSTSDLAPGVAALAIAVWLVAFLGIAWAALERRDA